MTQFQARLFIFCDEWLWVSILREAHYRREPVLLQAAIFAVGAIANWWIAYRFYWRKFDGEQRLAVKEVELRVREFPTEER